MLSRIQNPKDFLTARCLLGFTQAELAQALGWTGPKQVSNLENGLSSIQNQTALAVECLLRRNTDWTTFIHSTTKISRF
ncbi:helix-turn-helix transcriptional regulator [Candidatus Pacearchaeota archaeon]|nr:helix-turn-helix transcriptional regulator [Candidatus Pacearchaeota archaeon]